MEALFGQEPGTIPVAARRDSGDSIWVTYQAQTVESIPGYTPSQDPPLSRFGGYITDWKQKATGFFRTQYKDGRWWIIDPDGYPFHHRAVVAYTPGESDRQVAAFQQKFGTETA